MVHTAKDLMSPSESSSIRPIPSTGDLEEETQKTDNLDTQVDMTGITPDNSASGKSKRPRDTAFKQQRLKAWQPILTPRNVLPTLFILGILFIPLGIGFLVTVSQLQELTMDYTYCATLAPATPSRINFPRNAPVNWQSWSFTGGTCTLDFEIPKRWSGTTYLYYRLTNYYQNHRRYVKSVSSSQIAGDNLPRSSLTTDCDPLVGPPNSSIPYYPCGLVANSLFNDTFSNVVSASGPVLPFSESGIAWASDRAKFVKTSYQPSEVAVPPSWVFMGSSYTNASLASVAANEHLMVWMRPAALPTFRKLYSYRKEGLDAGNYSISIVMNYDVTGFEGTKSVVFSQVSWIGGKNNFLGIAYLVVGGLCILFGIMFLLKNFFAPRRLGDPAYLSWNQAQ